jgi:hypothetical protein
MAIRDEHRKLSQVSCCCASCRRACAAPRGGSSPLAYRAAWAGNSCGAHCTARPHPRGTVHCPRERRCPMRSLGPISSARRKKNAVDAPKKLGTTKAKEMMRTPRRNACRGAAVTMQLRPLQGLRRPGARRLLCSPRRPCAVRPRPCAIIHCPRERQCLMRTM